jgi:hypothetical protein
VDDEGELELQPAQVSFDPAAAQLTPVYDKQKPPTALPRAGSKQSLVIDMMSQDTGATLDAFRIRRGTPGAADAAANRPRLCPRT